MKRIIEKIFGTPLFEGIPLEDLETMLDCIGYHTSVYRKKETIVFEEDTVSHLGVVLSGAVDMVKEDLWGNKTMLVRSHPHELFGETFVCGDDTLSIVTFVASENTEILFMPFWKVTSTCSSSCKFHQQLIENMVRMIARWIAKVTSSLHDLLPVFQKSRKTKFRETKRHQQTRKLILQTLS